MFVGILEPGVDDDREALLESLLEIFFGNLERHGPYCPGPLSDVNRAGFPRLELARDGAA